MAKVFPCGGIGSHIGGCECADAPWNKGKVDDSLARRRRQRREQKPADRGKPPATSKDQLEWVRTDCSRCKGAKVIPRGRRTVKCPQCNGKGSFMVEKPKKE